MVHYTTHLTIMASVRLILLVPMIYYSYSGRRIKLAFCYYCFFILSVLFLFSHMVSILILDPESVLTLLISQRQIVGDSNGVSAYFSSMRMVWIMLILSTISSMFHFVMLRHLRTTAPGVWMAPGSEEMHRKKRSRFAYAFRQWRKTMEDAASTLEGTIASEATNEETTPELGLVVRKPVNLTPSERKQTGATESSDAEDEFLDSCQEYVQPLLSTPNTEVNGVFESDDLKVNLGRNSPGTVSTVEILTEVQARIESARQIWATKLEDVTSRIQTQMQNTSTSISQITQSQRVHSATQSSTFSEEIGSNSPYMNPVRTSNHVNSNNNNNNALVTWAPFPFIFAPLSPFRLLLQLYAYEEVISNGKLDACYDADGGESLTFYVPQLINFLLHGAFLNSDSLETFILSKCSGNVHFAHSCFWFLRAWCLGQGRHLNSPKFNVHEASPEQVELGSPLQSPGWSAKSIGSTSMTALDTMRIHGTDKNLYHQLSENSFQRKRSNSCDVESPMASVESHRSESKFNLEEYRMIEALLFRVVEAGEVHAKQLQDGRGTGEETAPLPSPLQSAPETDEHAFDFDGIPLSTDVGTPSGANLESVSSELTRGFLPALSPDYSLQDERSFPRRCDSRESDLFFATPRFLDALTSMADDLMLAPRDQRTKALRIRLRQLEAELLPSNVIYIPIGCMYHRVWRIVTNESIALSTKERVPCIVTLEVVDYNFTKRSLANVASSGKQKKHKQNMTEKEQIRAWVKEERPPQRINSIFEIISHHTYNSLKKIKDEIDTRKEMNLKKQNCKGEGDVEEGLIEKLEMANGSADVNSPLSNHSPGKESFRSPHRGKVASKTTAEYDQSISTINTLSSSPDHSFASPQSPTKPFVKSPEMGQWSSPTFFPGERESLTLDENALSELAQNFEDGSNSAWRSPTNRTSAIRKTVRRSSSSSSDGNYGATYSPTNGKTSLSNGGGKLPPTVPSQKKSDQTTITTDSNTPSSTTSRPPFVVFKEDWSSKEERLRADSAYGSHPGWRLLPVLIKSNDDLRQEQLASQLIQRMAAILARAKAPVWLYPYEIIALTDSGGIIEAIPDTISLDSLKRNDPTFTSMKNFYEDHFGPVKSDTHANAKANFVESLAGYSMVCFLLQIKDRHNGNILLDNKGHIIHIDFGFFFLSSPGQNSGFESAPFKLTRDFVDLMDGPNSRTFARFRELCIRTFLELRKHCYQIILLVEMIMEGNEDLACFRGKPEEAVRGLKERFRLDLNDRACVEYVNSLIDESVENWRTRWYDRYQRFCVGVL